MVLRRLRRHADARLHFPQGRAPAARPGGAAEVGAPDERLPAGGHRVLRTGPDAHQLRRHPGPDAALYAAHPDDCCGVAVCEVDEEGVIERTGPLLTQRSLLYY